MSESIEPQADPGLPEGAICRLHGGIAVDANGQEVRPRMHAPAPEGLSPLGAEMVAGLEAFEATGTGLDYTDAVVACKPKDEQAQPPSEEG